MLAVAVTVERIAVVVFAAFVVVGAATAVVGDGAVVWTVGVAASVVTEVEVVEVVVLLVTTFPPPPSAGVAAKSFERKVHINMRRRVVSRTDEQSLCRRIR